MLAIDPAAPDGELFRRIKLEELEGDERYDAVVTARTLHHITDLGPALDTIREYLRPSGVLVVLEFAWDRLDLATADWFYGQRRAVAAAHGHEPPAGLDDCRREWEAEHVGLHGYQALRSELDARFRERFFSWEPYLYRLLENGVAAEQLERGLIEAGAIRAVGWRYVGEPR